jgi:exosortase A-associated hydrolase 2
LETPLYFDRESLRLFGVLHEPDADAGRTPFVFCHPFGEEKLWAHRVFVTFARELARRGHPVLRFDCAGNGDSDGEFSASSLQSCLADLQAAIDWTRAKTRAPRVSLLGLRLGASLAWRAAASRTDIEALVLWAPIVDGKRYLQEVLRINLTMQMAVYGEVRQDREALSDLLRAGGTVNVEGYEISPAMAAQLDAMNLAEEAVPGVDRVMVAQIERTGRQAPAADIQRLASRVPAAVLECVPEEPFWKEIQQFYDRAPNLFSRTLQWLGHADAPSQE